MSVMGTVALMSLDEFEHLIGPDDVELLRGELIRMPPPQRSHMEICERLYELLKAALARYRNATPEARFGRVHIEMGYLITGNPQSWLRPDVSLTHPEQPGDRYYEGAPLIAFEVVSEHDTAAKLDRKVAEYLANGAAEVWAIYPETRHAWLYRSTPPAATRETQSIHTPLLPGIEIALDEILS
jgi:Uma2 family endonuclease